MSEESDHEEALLAMYVGGEEQEAAASVTRSNTNAVGGDGEEGEAAGPGERPREKRHKSGSGRYFLVEEVLCSNCNQPGHILRNCTQPYASSAACFFCGQIGHIQTNCPLKMDTLSTNFVAEEQCRSCFRVGHDERRCPDRRRVADSVNAIVASILRKREKNFCANCASVNHGTAQCRLPRYEEDYASAVKTTPRFGKKGGEKTARAAQECYTCGQVGHLKKDCPDKDKPRQKEPFRPFASRGAGNGNDRKRERDRDRRLRSRSPSPPQRRERSKGAGRKEDRSERRVFSFD